MKAGKNQLIPFTKQRSIIRYCQRIFILSLLISSCLGLCYNSKAQSIDPKFQSVFILGIVKQIEWSQNSKAFKIGLKGKNSALLRELNKLATSKKVNSKTIIVEQLSGSSVSKNHQVIFLATNSKNQLSNIISNVGSNTLVMTAHPNAISSGSHINFIMKGNKISFELNKTALDKTNLTLNSTLEKLALTVK